VVETAFQPKVNIIIDAVEKAYGLRHGQIRGRKRRADIAVPRLVAYWLARDITGYSFPRLGREFKRDHSTILDGIKSISKRRRFPINRELDRQCRELRDLLGYLDEDCGQPTRIEFDTTGWVE